MSGRLVSVNVGRPRQIGVRRGRPVMSSFVKEPVSGRVRVAGINVDGDQQVDLRYHGGPDKAVYAYAREDELWWTARLAREVGSGAFGENLTTEGVDVNRAVIGERWRIGTVELQVCQPRQPCFKLGLRFGDPKMLKQFAQANRTGAYLRILAEGELGVGDAVEVLDRPAHGVTIEQVSHAIMLDETGRAAAAAAPELPANLSRWMLENAA